MRKMIITCDRCGRETEKPERLEMNRNSLEKEEEFDLCKECLNEILDYIRNKK